MRHRNGRTIVGVSYADIRSGERSRCNVTPVTTDGRVALVASGAGRGSPLDPDDLDEESRQIYEAADRDARDNGYDDEKSRRLLVIRREA